MTCACERGVGPACHGDAKRPMMARVSRSMVLCQSYCAKILVSRPLSRRGITSRAPLLLKYKCYAQPMEALKSLEPITSIPRPYARQFQAKNLLSVAPESSPISLRRKISDTLRRWKCLHRLSVALQSLTKVVFSSFPASSTGVARE